MVTTRELMRALTYPKFKLTAEDQRELVADYLPYCTPVSMPATPPKTPPCRDPFDVPFLQLAITTQRIRVEPRRHAAGNRKALGYR